jgi:hypothetical protein
MFAVPSLILDNPWVFGLFVFLSVMLMFQLGRWLGRRIATEHTEGLGLLDGAIFALVGLLMAFTFSGASSRFDERRMLIVEESNAIGTARLRLDLLPPEARQKSLELMDRYVESRLETYRHPTDLEEAVRQHNKTIALQSQIWEIAIASGREPDALPAINISLLAALNQMFDIANTRVAIVRMHTPLLIYLFLWVAAMLASLIAGHVTEKVPGHRNFIHVVAFGLLMSLALYVALDYDYPRGGFIRETDFDSMLRGEAFPLPKATP